jgi:hypothetical protein
VNTFANKLVDAQQRAFVRLIAVVRFRGVIRLESSALVRAAAAQHHLDGLAVGRMFAHWTGVKRNNFLN